MSQRINIYLLLILMSLYFSCEQRKISNRKVEDNKLISNYEPNKTFIINKTLTFLADTSFVLSEKSNAEVYFYADNDTGQINRFLQFQFESFKPEIEDTYKYELNDSIKIGNLDFGYNFWCFNLNEIAKERPNSDIAVVQHLLNSNHVNTPGNYVGLRFVYLTKDKRSELLIISGENTNLRKIDCQQDSSALPLLEEIFKEVVTSFTIKN